MRNETPTATNGDPQPTQKPPRSQALLRRRRTRVTLLACLGLMVGFGLLILPPLAQAQDLLGLLKGSSSSTLTLRSPEEIKIASLQARHKEVAALLPRMLDREQQQATRISQELSEVRKEMAQNRLGYQRALNGMHIQEGTLRIELTQLYQQLLLLLQSKESALNSRNQSVRSLRNSLSRSIRLRQAVERGALEKWPRQALKRAKREMKKMLAHNKRGFTQSNKRITNLSAQVDADQLVADQARKKLLAPLRTPTSQPSSIPPTSQPSVPGVVLPPTDGQPDDLLKQQQKRATLEGLKAQSLRIQFDIARHRLHIHQTELYDERYSREQHKILLQLATYGLKRIAARFKELNARSEGGLWFRKKFTLSMASWSAVLNHTKKLFVQTPETLGSIRKSSLKALRGAQKTWGSALLPLLGIMSLLFLAVVLLVRRFLHGKLRNFRERVKDSPKTWAFWGMLTVFSRVLYDLMFFLLLGLPVLFLIEAIDMGVATEALLLKGLMALLALRLIFTLCNELFNHDPEVRALLELDQRSAIKFRRTIKSLCLLLCGQWMIVQSVYILKFPDALLSLVDVFFAGLVVSCAMIVLWSKDDLLSLLPRDTELSRRVVIWTFRLYRYIMLVILGLFFLYLWGYRNLAVFIARGLALSVVLGFLGNELHRILWQGTLWALGFAENNRGLIHLEKRTAGNILRFFRFFWGLTLGVLALLLLLEVWGISGAHKAIWKAINYPLVQVKDTHVTTLSLGKLILTVLSAVWLSKQLQTRLNQYIYPLLRLSPSAQYAANTLFGYIIVIIGALAGLQWMGVGLGGLAVFAGVIGIGVGFGLQNIANNFISGLLIIFGRPIAINDVIEVGGLTGQVKEISTRSVKIETLDSRVVLIPNAEILTSKVINWSLGPGHVWVNLEVGVAYGSDVRLVEKLLLEIANKHPQVLKVPPPAVRFQSFGNNSLDFVLWVPVSELLRRFVFLSEMRFEVDKAFHEHGITIAFPQRDIHLDPPFQQALIDSLSSLKPPQPAHAAALDAPPSQTAGPEVPPSTATQTIELSPATFDAIAKQAAATIEARQRSKTSPETPANPPDTTPPKKEQ